MAEDNTSLEYSRRSSRAMAMPPPPRRRRQTFLAAWLRVAADCLYLALYFVTKFLVDLTDAVSISSVLASQFLIATALVASAVVISPTAAGSLRKGDTKMSFALVDFLRVDLYHGQSPFHPLGIIRQTGFAFAWLFWARSCSESFEVMMENI